MSDERKIDALAPRPRRTGAAHSLQAADREPQPIQDRPETFPDSATAVAAAAPRSKGRRSRPVAPDPQPKRVQLAADVSGDLRGRSRAAFRLVSFYEGVGKFSEFVANALEAEIRRIELEHNDGQPLEASADRLPTGRQPGR